VQLDVGEPSTGFDHAGRKALLTPHTMFVPDVSLATNCFAFAFDKVWAAITSSHPIPPRSGPPRLAPPRLSSPRRASPRACAVAKMKFPRVFDSGRATAACTGCGLTLTFNAATPALVGAVAAAEGLVAKLSLGPLALDFVQCNHKKTLNAGVKVTAPSHPHPHPLPPHPTPPHSTSAERRGAGARSCAGSCGRGWSGR
jgi:hypothetical protein